MDQQRPLLYLTLVFLGFMIWTAWQQDHAPKPVSAPTNTASAANASSTDAPSIDVPQTSSTAGTPPTIANTAPTNNLNGSAGSIIRIKTDTLQFEINTRGGNIEHADLPTYPISIDEQDKPVIILDRAKQYTAQSGLGYKQIAGQKGSDFAPNHYATYTSAKSEYILAEGEDTLIVPLTWTNGKGITVTKRYIFKRGKFNVAVEHEVDNASQGAWSGFEYRQLRRGPAEEMTGGIFGGVRAYIGPAFYDYEDGKYKYEKYDFGDFDDPLNKKIEGGWAAMLEHYFISAWIPPQKQTNTFYSKLVPHDTMPNYILGLKTALVDLAPGAKHTFKSTLYVGPVIQEDLKQIADGLDLTVDYGVFSFVSKPIFWLLKLMHSFFGNWGWAIIFVTITIKLIFFYPSAMSYKSMAKMKKLSPKMKEMQTRYKNDPQAKQKAMMEFYRKEKINPLGGCLPMLIQIPVFMGLYWVLQESVELRQAPWLGWYKDLSIMDPYLILPLLMGASMWFQQKLNPPQMDPMQQKIFQWLPVVFTVMFLFFPAGLVLYWLVNNVLSIAQQWYINKKIVGNG
ncbi:MAG: membrane protein insertase YidC [Thiotrichaceae bacterium]